MSIEISPVNQSRRLETKLRMLVLGIDIKFDSLARLSNSSSVFPSDYKISMKKMSDRHFISRSASGRALIPDELLLQDETGSSVVKVYYRDDSPLKLTVDSGDPVIQDESQGSQIDIAVFFVPDHLQRISDGRFASQDYTYLSVAGSDRVSLIPFVGCEEFNDGSGCRFCGWGGSHSRENSSLPDLTEIQEDFDGQALSWWRAHRETVISEIETEVESLDFEKLGPHFHFLFLTGNFWDQDSQWEVALDILSRIPLKYSDCIDSYITMMPPDDFDYLRKAHKLGIKSVAFNLEVYTQSRFEEVCPGKDRRYGYEHLREALRQAVHIFGPGNVRTNLVLGAEAVENTVSGAHKLAAEGIVPDYTVFYPRPGSAWASRSPPDAVAVASAAKKIDQVYDSHNFSPIYCSTSSRSSIANEVHTLQ